MTKKDLILAVGEQNIHLPEETVKAGVHLFFELISFYLKNHHRVELRGFGTLSLRRRAAHQAHNPKNGQHVSVPEKWVPFFRASSVVKEDLKKDRPRKRHAKQSGFFDHMYKGAASKEELG